MSFEGGSLKEGQVAAKSPKDGLARESGVLAGQGVESAVAQEEPVQVGA